MYSPDRCQASRRSKFAVLGEEIERRVSVLGEQAAFESLTSFFSTSCAPQRFSINALCKALDALSFRDKTSRLPAAKKAKALAKEMYPDLHRLIVDVTQTSSRPLCDIGAYIAAARAEVAASANHGLATRFEQVFPEKMEMGIITTADVMYEMQCWLQGCIC